MGLKNHPSSILTAFREKINSYFGKIYFNCSEPHLDSAALHLDMASRHMKLYEKALIHAGMTRAFPYNFAWL